MKKQLLISAIVFLLFIPLATSQPRVDHTMFYQEKLTAGEDIVLGVQFLGSDIVNAQADLIKNAKTVDSTELLDRQGDDFYSGSLGPVEGGKIYQVKVTGLNENGQKTSETYTRSSQCGFNFLGNCLN